MYINCICIFTFEMVLVDEFSNVLFHFYFWNGARRWIRKYNYII